VHSVVIAEGEKLHTCLTSVTFEVEWLAYLPDPSADYKKHSIACTTRIPLILPLKMAACTICARTGNYFDVTA